jgi:proline iminopeptidase
MMSSIPAYNAYAEEVLKPAMDPDALAEIEAFEEAGEFDDPRYMELLMGQHYVEHVLRMPADTWPEPVQRSFANTNPDIYVLMQGPSELGLRGTLEGWDRSSDLGRIGVPTLVIGSRYDTMDPSHMEWMAGVLPLGRYLYCEKGSHMAMYDDQETYFEGLIEFIREVDDGS